MKCVSLAWLSTSPYMRHRWEALWDSEEKIAAAVVVDNDIGGIVLAVDLSAPC
jgi:hypothetical protein